MIGSSVQENGGARKANGGHGQVRSSCRGPTSVTKLRIDWRQRFAQNVERNPSMGMGGHRWRCARGSPPIPVCHLRGRRRSFCGRYQARSRGWRWKLRVKFARSRVITTVPVIYHTASGMAWQRPDRCTGFLSRRRGEIRAPIYLMTPVDSRERRGGSTDRDFHGVRA